MSVFDARPNLADPGDYGTVIFPPSFGEFVKTFSELADMRGVPLVCSSKCQCSDAAAHGAPPESTSAHDCWTWGFNWTRGLCWACFATKYVEPLRAQVRALDCRERLAKEAINYFGRSFAVQRKAERAVRDRRAPAQFVASKGDF